MFTSFNSSNSYDKRENKKLIKSSISAAALAVTSTSLEQSILTKLSTSNKQKHTGSDGTIQIQIVINIIFIKTVYTT